MSTDLIYDPVSPKAYEELHYASACEDCSHFDPVTGVCTLGFPNDVHRKTRQQADLKEHHALAFCRIIEID